MSDRSDSRLSRGALQDLIVRFLLEHPEHRGAFLRDPRSALAQYLGVETGLNVASVADTIDTAHIVLPRDSGELTESDLERVSGGTRGSSLYQWHEDFVIKGNC